MGDVFGLGSAVGGGLQAAGTMSAASTQASAMNHATDVASQQYQQTRNDLNPFSVIGQAAAGQALANAGNYFTNGGNYTTQMTAEVPTQTLGSVGSYMPTLQNNSVVPQSMTQAQLEATPGYQFDLSQGLKSTQSAAAARGLGVSGAALKGAASFATGLADNTYQNQFAIQQQQFSDQLNKDNQNYGQQNQNFANALNLGNSQYQQQQGIFGDWNNIANFNQGVFGNYQNQLMGLGQLGENAAAQTGSTGASLANANINANTAGANNLSNSLLGGTNNLTSTLNNYLNGQQQNNYLNKLFGNGGSYSGSGTNAFDG